MTRQLKYPLKAGTLAGFLLVSFLTSFAQNANLYNNGMIIYNRHTTLSVNSSYAQTDSGYIFTRHDPNAILPLGKFFISDSLLNNSSGFNLFKAFEEGAVYFIGDSASVVGGTGGEIIFEKIVVQKNGSADTVYLLKNFNVKDSLYFSKGNIQLNGDTIILEPYADINGNISDGNIFNESDNNRISGAGEIVKYQFINTGDFQNGRNFGGMGAEIEDGNNQNIGGDFTVKRGHTAFAINADSSIARYYDFIYQQPTDAEFKFHYLENDLGNISEISLKYFRSDDNGNSWVSQGGDTVYSFRNYAQRDSANLSPNGTSAMWTLSGCDKPPHIPAGQGGIVCGSDTITLDAGAGKSRYKWSTGETTQTMNYIPAVSQHSYFDTITVWLDSAGCTSLRAIMIEYHPEILLSLNDTTKCEGVALFLDATQADTFTTPAFTWENAGGILGNANTLSVVDTGTYWVTVSYNGCSAADTMTITDVAIPVLPPNQGGTFCGDTTIVLDAGPGKDSYLWSTGATTQTTVYTMNGAAGFNDSVSITMGIPGCLYTDAIPVQYHPDIVFNLPDTALICSNGSLLLDATQNDPAASYWWFTDNQNTPVTCPTASSGTPGLYPPWQQLNEIIPGVPFTQVIKFEMVHGNPGIGDGYYYLIDSISGLPSGLTYSMQHAGTGFFNYDFYVTCITISGITNEPSGLYDIDLWIDYQYVPGSARTYPDYGNIELLWPQHYSATYNLEIAPSDSNALSISTADTYYVVAQNNGCPASVDSVVVINSTEPEPILHLYGNYFDWYCPGYGLDACDGCGGDISYQWSNGDSTLRIFVDSSGTYSVTATNADGCSATDFATVFVLQADAIYSVQNVSCNGGNDGAIFLDSVISNAAQANNGVSFIFEILDSAGQVTTSANLAAGTYYARLYEMDYFGCYYFDTLLISEPPAIQTTLAATNVTCIGGSDGQIALQTIANAVQPITFLWSTGDTTDTITGLVSGTYSVTITDSIGCSAADTATILNGSQLPPNIGLNGARIKVCFDSTYLLDAGISGMTYLWSNNDTLQQTTVSNSGTYNVTVTDASGCSATDMAEVYFVKPEIFYSSQPVTCNGGNNGTITVDSIISDATAAVYQFQWADLPAQISPRSGLSAGTYVLITNETFYGCASYYDTITVTEPDSILTSVVVTDVTCVGGSDGQINLSVLANAVLPATYLWSNGATSEDLDSLIAGVYSVTITDDVGCTVAVNNIAVQDGATSAPDIQLNGATVNVCFDSTAALDAGVAGMNYLWSTNETLQQITVANTNLYRVTVTNAQGCSAVDSAQVNFLKPERIYFAQNVTCNAGNDGAITVISIDSDVPAAFYQFEWADLPAQDYTRTNLVAGTYILITEEITYGCSFYYDTITITEPVVIQTSVAVTDVVCGGGSTGQIDLTVTDAVSPLTYLWSNGATTQDLNLLTAGTYYVTVTDNNTCTVFDTAIVSAPASVNVTSAVTHVSCFGKNDGAIDITPSGGTQPYTYQWNTGLTTQNLSALDGGSYSVTVTDSNACTFPLSSIIVNEPTAISATLSTTQASCGVGDGTATVDTVSGGTSPYFYLWLGSGNTNATELNLASGIHTVVITDNAGCTDTNYVAISNSSAPIISSSVTLQHVSCNGANDGAINISVSVGNPPYSFIWSNGATSEDISGIAGGNYFITVTDTALCSAVGAYIINEPAALTLAGIVTNETCNGSADGAIGTFVSGGTLPYLYNWSNSATDSSIAGLTDGTYFVTVTEAHLCAISDSFSVNDGASISLVLSVTDVRCNGNYDGSIDLAALGGSGTLSYSWNIGEISQDITALAPGNYAVTVTDALGCSGTGNDTVREPAALSLLSVVVAQTCSYNTDGSVSINVSGGILPYQYNWSNSETDSTISGLVNGTYHVTVTDSNFCTLADTFDVSGGLAITLSLNATDVVCNGNNDGTIIVTAAGGAGTLSYLWNDSDTTEDRTSLAPGSYSVTVTDTLGCFASANDTVNEPALLTGSTAVQNISCYENNDGSINLSISGGIIPYQVNWSNSDTVQNISGLFAGNYDVTVTDNNSCVYTTSASISRPDSLLAVIFIRNEGCRADNEGLVSITPQGGTSPYNYLWNTGDTVAVISNLNQGDYSFTITDVNGCNINSTVAVDSVPPFEVKFLSASLVNAEDTIYFADVSFPQPVSWFWSFGDSLGTTSSDTNPLFAYPKRFIEDTSFYNVTLIASSNECVDSMTKLITVINGPGKGGPGINRDSLARLPLDFVQITAYPNPTMGSLTIDIELNKEGSVALTLIDIMGKHYQTLQLSGSTDYKQQVNIGHLAAGQYFIRAQSGKQVYGLQVTLVH